jgi:hypothetical protein
MQKGKLGAQATALNFQVVLFRSSKLTFLVITMTKNRNVTAPRFAPKMLGVLGGTYDLVFYRCCDYILVTISVINTKLLPAPETPSKFGANLGQLR